MIDEGRAACVRQRSMMTDDGGRRAQSRNILDQRGTRLKTKTSASLWDMSSAPSR